MNIYKVEKRRKQYISVCDIPMSAKEPQQQRGLGEGRVALLV
jgi:hypothetical protein